MQLIQTKVFEVAVRVVWPVPPKLRRSRARSRRFKERHPERVKANEDVQNAKRKAVKSKWSKDNRARINANARRRRQERRNESHQSHVPG